MQCGLAGALAPVVTNYSNTELECLNAFRLHMCDENYAQIACCCCRAYYMTGDWNLKT
jgi:hypothetical protein